MHRQPPPNPNSSFLRFANLQCEVRNVAVQWEKQWEEFRTRTVEYEGEGDEVEVISESCSFCRECALCC